MASIQDVINAAFQIGQSAQEASQRSALCAETLRTNGQELAQVTEGSASGQAATAQVLEAAQATGECAAKLAGLQSAVNDFIADISK